MVVGVCGEFGLWGVGGGGGESGVGGGVMEGERVDEAADFFWYWLV